MDRDDALKQAFAAVELNRQHPGKGWDIVARIYDALANPKGADRDTNRNRLDPNPHSKGNEHETLRRFSLQVRQ